MRVARKSKWSRLSVSSFVFYVLKVPQKCRFTVHWKDLWTCRLWCDWNTTPATWCNNNTSYFLRCAPLIYTFFEPCVCLVHAEWIVICCDTHHCMRETGTGHQQDAQACYERALQVSPSELWPHQGFVRSLMEMGQLNMALLHTTGILADKYVCDGGRVLDVMGLTWLCCTPLASWPTSMCDGGKVLEVMGLMPSRQVWVWWWESVEG